MLFSPLAQDPGLLGKETLFGNFQRVGTATHVLKNWAVKLPSTQAALQEFIDNSFSVGSHRFNASKVWINLIEPKSGDGCGPSGVGAQKVLTVLDDGIGMSMETMRKSFMIGGTSSDLDLIQHSMYGVGMKDALCHLGPLGVTLSIADGFCSYTVFGERISSSELIMATFTLPLAIFDYLAENEITIAKLGHLEEYMNNVYIPEKSRNNEEGQKMLDDWNTSVLQQKQLFTELRFDRSTDVAFESVQGMLDEFALIRKSSVRGTGTRIKVFLHPEKAACMRVSEETGELEIRPSVDSDWTEVRFRLLMFKNTFAAR